MAHKRMFSKDITASDAFRDMPPSSQALYFHLGMEADDDGFLGNYKALMRGVNATEDDLKILFAKRFLILFKSGVVVVKHWLINNTVRKDRYTETKYLEEKKSLFLKENGAYTEKENHGIPIGNHSATTGMHRIGEDRIEKDRIVTPLGVTRAKRVEPSRAIDEILNYLKGRLGVTRLDGSESGNRRYAHLMLKKIGGNEHDAAERVKKIIDTGLGDKFHAKNITDVRYIYYNGMKIILSNKIGEAQGPKWKVWL